MKHLLLSGLVFAGAFRIPCEVEAVEVTIGRTKIELVGPKGFYPFDNKHSLGSRLINFAQQAVQGRNVLYCPSLNCDQIKTR